MSLLKLVSLSAAAIALGLVLGSAMGAAFLIIGGL